LQQVARRRHRSLREFRRVPAATATSGFAHEAGDYDDSALNRAGLFIASSLQLPFLIPGVQSSTVTVLNISTIEMTQARADAHSSIEPLRAQCRQIATGGLQFPGLAQRHQALFGLEALLRLMASFWLAELTRYSSNKSAGDFSDGAVPQIQVRR
jgi:hypothetical protein